jgi:hypothetical protein
MRGFLDRSRDFQYPSQDVSPLGQGGLISNLLPGEKVLRYEADEGSLGSVVYSISDTEKTVLVVKVAHRREVYR